jgi:ABC-type nitrate/sulfonate/bicarbonate transport system substrate-binding protein
MADNTVTGRVTQRLRRPALWLAASALVVPLAACGEQAPPPATAGQQKAPTKVVTTVADSIATTPLQMAVAKGFFTEHNIELEVAPSTPPSQTIQLLIGGKLDIALASPGAALNNAIAGNANLVMLGGAASVPSDAAKPNSGLLVTDKAWQGGVKSVADLRGQTIHITPSVQSASGMAAAKLLEKDGLKLSDVKTQDWTDQPKMVQAFEAGSADIMWALEPALSSLQRKGAHLIGSGSEVLPGSPALAIVANRKWVEANPDATVDYLAAYLQGVKYVNDGLESGWSSNADTLDVLSESTGMPVEGLKGIAFSEFPADGKVDPKAVEEIVNFMRDLGSVKTVVDPNTYIDQSYLDKALEQAQR